MVENMKKEAYARKDEGCLKLLDKEWIEEKKLELRLGPPDDCEWNKKAMSRGDESLHLLPPPPLPFGSFSNPISGIKRAFSFRDTIKDEHVFSAPSSKPSFLHLQQPTSLKKESTEKKEFSPPAAAAENTDVDQKRTGPARVVGWPPVRSFRRNLAISSNLNPNHISQIEISNKFCNKKPVENNQKGIFVKINMDGVAIGRKVDLNVYDSYEKLSSAVDDLFRDLLAAQGDSALYCTKNKGEDVKVISGVLDGSGEYTLVYEDNEGDRMLVGDVPWKMFISTVKRLRVLKTSEISSLCKESRLKEVVS